MLRLLGRLAGVVLAIALLAGTAACASNNYEHGEVEVTTYQGRDLLCRVTPAARDFQYHYDCDFARFYADTKPIDKSVHRMKAGTLVEKVVTYQGGKLHCLVYKATPDTTASTCDFVRFAAEGGK